MFPQPQKVTLEDYIHYLYLVIFCLYVDEFYQK